MDPRVRKGAPFLAIGIAFLAIGVAGRPAFAVIGLAFIVIAFVRTRRG